MAAEPRPVRGWRRVRHRLEYGAILVLCRLFRLLPHRLALAVGAAIGQLAWWTRLRRRLVLTNLAHALPAASPRRRRQIAARAARNFGRTVTDYLRFGGRPLEEFMAGVEVEGLEVLRLALAEGRGAVMVTGHLGAWALYTAVVGASGMPAAQLVGVQRNASLDAFIANLPGEAMELIPKGKSAPRRILRALAAGKVVVLVADHYSSDQQVCVPFLGRPAYSLPLPGALVARHEVPLLTMVGHRVGGLRHRVRIARLAIPPQPTPDATRVEVAVRYNAALGDAVLEHPDQYFWYHDRWKSRGGKSASRRRARWVAPEIAEEDSA